MQNSGTCEIQCELVLRWSCWVADDGLTNGRYIVTNLEAVKERQQKEVEIFQEMLFSTQLQVELECLPRTRPKLVNQNHSLPLHV